MPYTPVGWKDFPNEETPLSATNLNKMDMQIKENTEKLDNFDPDLPENLLICDDEAPEETETLPNVADRLTDETASYTASDIKNEFDEVEDNLEDLNNKVRYGILDVAGAAINNADGNYYYSNDIDVSIPSGCVIISANMYGVYTTGVSCIVRGNSKIALQCYKSVTLPANRRVIYVYYQP